MLILLTNDDGIESEALLNLREHLSSLGEVEIIAPERNWSAAGHTKTLHRPLRVYELTLKDGVKALATDGTPSDCVALAALGILKDKPNLVVSGINKGANLGDDVTYSGTVAAAMEGIINGIPSIAVSLASYTDWKFDFAAKFTADLAKYMISKKLGSDVLLNVNVPNLPKEEIQGIAVTRLGKRLYRDELVERRDPQGRLYYWIGGEVPAGVPEEGTDIKAIAENKISVTPIHLDLTNHKLIAEIQRWRIEEELRL